MIIIITIGNGCRTKGNRSMAKDVDDFVACDKKPYEQGLGQQIYGQGINGRIV